MCFGISPFPTVYQSPNRIFHFYSHRSPISVYYQSNMGKKSQKVKLTPAIWNELRILCALRGYSSMKQGKGKTAMQQHDAMYQYCHGKPLSHPSQIKIICNGIIICVCLRLHIFHCRPLNQNIYQKNHKNVYHFGRTKLRSGIV